MKWLLTVSLSQTFNHFFDAYAQVEAIRQELSSSKRAHGREIGKVAADVLMSSKAKFDELGICIQCAYDNENVEKLKGFEQIRVVFLKRAIYILVLLILI